MRIFRAFLPTCFRIASAVGAEGGVVFQFGMAVRAEHDGVECEVCNGG